MLERLYLKDQLSFKECDLEFGKGLIAFSGPSGAGKSVFMQGILSLFGQSEANASMIEATISGKLDLEEYGIESEDINIFKYTKTKSVRYFINANSVSKKMMNSISKSFINYLSIKEVSEFENENLINLLDAIIAKDNPLHVEEVTKYKNDFKEYIELKNKLDEIESKEKKIEELKEFARFEISKIDEISPKIGEDEELMNLKKELSRKEKISEALESANAIFECESSVNEFLSLIDKDSSFFDETLNELRVILEDERARLEDLDDVDVESLLDRIEKISSLKSRYGSIEEVLEYRDKKQKELEEYENISFKKSSLQKECATRLSELENLADEISKNREQYLSKINEKINSYLDMLYMPKVNVINKQVELYELGKNELEVELGNVNIKKISSGEFNRLRLAFIATSSEYLMDKRGILILDEIDANLSGKESMSVANVLKKLSDKYQIFAISHQPQLSSVADFHFLITKENGQSSVKELKDKERVEELARMISGENISQEALEFAKKLL
ncbi:AAA family ATPase [Sulfurospirillum sp. 1307]|jgi:DNA repair protein RecN (Recombination protein N)